MADMAGYSGKPMIDKLGLKPGYRVYASRLPRGLALQWPADVTVVARRPRQPVDIAWSFVTSRAELAATMPSLIACTVVNGAVWVSWPKRSSGVTTDLNENVVRQIGLAARVVDVKVAAVDDTWSALKFVRRLADRQPSAE